MKGLKYILGSAALVLALASCGNSGEDKNITVCASDVPHAEILNGSVKTYVEAQGYKLNVTVLDWTTQNDAVANGDYDANYFQHVPYLETYTGTTELVATCKVHYEPLGIYKGKADASLDNVKSIEVCDDVSNAIRAFELLKAKGILSEIPVKDDALTFEGSSWTSTEGITVTLIAENLLVSSRTDYDLACLPCNTALTGNVSATERLLVEDDPAQVSLKANVLAVRKADYLNNASYKAKIDVLTDALLSTETSTFVKNQYNGVITCDSSSQIDLRSLIK